MLDSDWLSPTKPGTAQESRSVSAGSNSGEFFNLTAYKVALHLLSETKKKYEISFSTANTLALKDCKATFKLSKRMPADSGRIHCFMPVPESNPRYPSQCHHRGTGITAPAIRWTACGCDRKGDTRYTKRLSFRSRLSSGIRLR